MGSHEAASTLYNGTSTWPLFGVKTEQNLTPHLPAFKVGNMADKSDVECATAASALYSSFNSGKSLSYEWRVEQLLALKKLVSENRNAIHEAIGLDLGLFINIDPLAVDSTYTP
jgi:acyl-CoA reductase-like NAD-dependent aldehyde dehydrogenase